MPTSVAVLPSPFLPGTAYAPLVEALGHLGVRVTLADPTRAPSEDAETLMARWADATRTVDALVAHSNAGLLAPVVRARGRTARRVVFVDAALLPDEGRTALAPPDLRTMLASRTDAHGRLPAWTRWWGPGALTEVVPAELLEVIDRTCPELPLSYLEHEVRAPSGWTELDNAYLAFGDTYADERSRADQHGWPTATIPGGHLHFLRDPDHVAAAVLDLAHRSP